MEGAKVEVVAEAHLIVRGRVANKGQDAIGGRTGRASRIQCGAAVDGLEDRDQLTLLNERISEPTAE